MLPIKGRSRTTSSTLYLSMIQTNITRVFSNVFDPVIYTVPRKFNCETRAERGSMIFSNLFLQHLWKNVRERFFNFLSGYDIRKLSSKVNFRVE